MTGMRHFLLIIAVVVGQSVLAADKKPLTKEESAKVIEAAIRTSLKKPTGELTKAELTKVTYLDLGYTKITDAGLKDIAKLEKLKRLILQGTQITDEGLWEVAKLQQLKSLNLVFCPKVTKAGVAGLQKALPNCRIASNPRK